MSTTTYEVTVTFLMEQPDDLLLSQAEIEDNVVMTFDEFDLTTIGHALVIPATFSAQVAKAEPDDEED